MPQENPITVAPVEQQNFTYPLRNRDGHLVAEVAGRWLLIDTGAPVSIGTTDIEFAGQVYSPSRNFLGVSIDSLPPDLSSSIDALIGMDMLADFDLRIDVPARRFEISRNELELSPGALPISLLGGVPLVNVSFSPGNQESLLFDTGANLSYLRRELLNGCTPHGEAEDFYPGFGHFSTPVYRMQFTLGQRWHCVDFGVLPELLELTLMAQGAGGIIGSQLILDRPMVLSSRRGLLELSDESIESAGSIRDGQLH